MDENNIYKEVRNGSHAVGLREIPVLEYDRFYEEVCSMLSDERFHCMFYFCYPAGGFLKFICGIGDDDSGTIRVLSHEYAGSDPLRSLTARVYAMHIFEREIWENHGVVYDQHPWLKPVRYPHDRPDRNSEMDNYPFYEIDSEELHEVGVGPVHAGVIEPGHFRFICNGEKVLHLEIQLGYQHRGMERLFTDTGAGLRSAILSENIAGDSAVGHGLAHAQLAESLAFLDPAGSLQAERCIALELERIAVHIGDTAALCGDVAYQLGQSACEALRTLVINTTQYWCGNRFGKGLIRPGGTNFPLTEDIAGEILNVLQEVDRRFSKIADRIYSLPSLLGRFEDIGTVTRAQAIATGTVGMAARSCGLPRDTRSAHPFQYYRHTDITPVIQEGGDVLARARLRAIEVKESISIIKDLISGWQKMTARAGKPCYDLAYRPDSLAISLTEGWRGEICHVAVTDSGGLVKAYKIKDPSMHNWMALALAVRNQEISDFPVCNKSFNLSYCGHDL